MLLEHVLRKKTSRKMVILFVSFFFVLATLSMCFLVVENIDNECVFLCVEGYY